VKEQLDARSLLRSIEMKPTVVLLASVTLVAVHRYFGRITFASTIFPSISSRDAAWFECATTILLMGIVPLAIVTLIFRESGRDYGLRLGNWKFGLLFIAVTFPIIAAVSLYPATKIPEMRIFYPIDKGAALSISAFLQLELPSAILLLGWEFLFRGFMIFGLRDRVGSWLAICIQTIPSTLWHIGLPWGVTFGALIGGVMFGFLAVRTKSILWPLLLHYLIWVGLDLFIILTS
jgi:membrane protease YdiL (CAAX protease family)